MYSATGTNLPQVFVLDNSLRESTVGQDKGHTLADKVGIYDAVKSCGFRHIVIGGFNAERQVDDDFVRHLKGDSNSAIPLSLARERDSSFHGTSSKKTHFYAFTDPADTVEGGRLIVEPGREPIALRKMVEYGHINPIIEVDLNGHDLDWGGAWDVEQMADILRKDLEFAYDADMEAGGGFVNLRDFPVAMVLVPERVTALVASLAHFPSHLRPRGILVEEPMGAYLPCEVRICHASYLWVRVRVS